MIGRLKNWLSSRKKQQQQTLNVENCHGVVEYEVGVTIEVDNETTVLKPSSIQIQPDEMIPGKIDSTNDA